MDNPRGRVITVNHGQSEPSAEVEVSAAAGCARCRSGKGCGAGLLGGSAKTHRVLARIGAGIRVAEGDQVRIELAPRNLLRAALLTYGLPLGGALLAAACAHFAGLADSHAALAGLVGIGAGLIIAHGRLRASTCLREFTPMIVERVSAAR